MRLIGLVADADTCRGNAQAGVDLNIDGGVSLVDILTGAAKLEDDKPKDDVPNPRELLGLPDDDVDELTKH